MKQTKRERDEAWYLGSLPVDHPRPNPAVLELILGKVTGIVAHPILPTLALKKYRAGVTGGTEFDRLTTEAILAVGCFDWRIVGAGVA